MENETIYALIARFLLIPFYIYLVYFFRKKYLESKKAGFENKFIIGFAVMFLVILGYQTFTAFYELLGYLNPSYSNFLEGKFPGTDTQEFKQTLWIFANLASLPLYIVGESAFLVIYAAQIYPLEIILNLKRKPLSKLLYITAALLLLIFIQPIRESYIALILIALWVLELLIAFFFNLGINIKLAVKSTGVVRRRALMMMLAFILFNIGIIWALEVGWAKSIWSGFGLKMDIVFGSILQA
ncbi:MAG: hypothetical protein ACTSXF_14660, partial [Promethearchaeota archaeon]